VRLRRTDLALSLEDVMLQRLDREPISLSNGMKPSRTHELQSLALSGQCRFKNDKDFPISLSVASVRFRQGAPIRPKAPATTENISSQLVEWSWLTDETVALERVFGSILTNQPAVIEPKGEVGLPLYLVFRFQWGPREKYRLLELDIEATAEAVHPGTGQIIKQAKKEKRMTYRGIVAKDQGIIDLIRGSVGGVKG
jgi:hypothetical protein